MSGSYQNHVGCIHNYLKIFRSANGFCFGCNDSMGIWVGGVYLESQRDLRDLRSMRITPISR